MSYEEFRRHLREKYPTRFHLVDQLVDQMKRIESSKPAEKSKTKKKMSFEPYLNECVRAAERVHHQSRSSSDRDRRICYENYLLAEKLQSIEKTKKINRRPSVTTTISDDQATVADVDLSMNESDWTEQRQEKIVRSSERLYEHLNRIDRMIDRDRQADSKSVAFKREILYS